MLLRFFYLRLRILFLQILAVLDNFFLSRKTCWFNISYIDPLLQSGNICIFASYSRGNCVQPRVFIYLEFLKSKGFQTIFVTTSYLSPADESKIQKSCSAIIKRENIGFDFGSWAIGLNFLKKQNFKIENLLLANDSVIGPFFDIDFESFSKFKITGMTDSAEVRFHIQSYFLYFPSMIVKSDFFELFWYSNFKFLKFKSSVIHSYEIGLSKFAAECGILVDAVFPSLMIRRILHSNPSFLLSNPTHVSPDLLVLNLSFPFLKADIVRKGVRGFCFNTTTFMENFLIKHGRNLSLDFFEDCNRNNL